MKQPLNENLTPEQKAVLGDKATERPYSGALLDISDDGIYSCANCHTQLFESDNKYDAGCGWPSFDTAIEGAIEYIADSSHGMERTETICATCGGHLGHVFDVGRSSATGQWYCINSLSLDFSPQPDK